jgi:hypothetical protein
VVAHPLGVDGRRLIPARQLARLRETSHIRPSTFSNRILKIPPYTLKGVDLTTHSSSLLGTLQKWSDNRGPSLNQSCKIVYFYTKKSRFGYILERLGMDHVGIFYGQIL